MIDILLASYNGETYISEQIESIINQTYKDWFLYIKDDCSTDNTVNIILDYEKKYKDKIKVIISEEPSGSAKNNFFSILQYSKNEYVMTCDQDDIWLPDKIQITHDKMLETEANNIGIPILVHTDLKVTDENLNIISDSLFKLQNLESQRDKLNNLLVQNIVTGCTIMVNRNLLNYIKNPPKYAIMHDWWMALIAAAMGKIIFINSPTVLYRQHGKNSVGAKNVKSLNYIINRLSQIENIKLTLRDTYKQAEELSSVVVGSIVSSKEKFMIIQYSKFCKYNKMQKIYLIIKYRLYKSDLVRFIGQILFS